MSFLQSKRSTVFSRIALGVLLVLAGLRSPLAQRMEPYKPKPYEPAEENHARYEGERRTAESSGHDRVEITPSLSISVPPDADGGSLGSPGYRKEVKQYYIDQFTSLSSVPISPSDQLRVVSLVDNTDTDNALQHLKKIVLTPTLRTAEGLRELFSNNRDKVFVVIGHIDDVAHTFAGIPIVSLEQTAEASEARAMFLGCYSADFIGSGATTTINSIDVVERLIQAMNATTLGEFLSRLSGPELKLQLQWSLIANVAHTLHIIVVENSGARKLDISLVGFKNALPEVSAPTQTISKISLSTGVPYGLLVAVISIAVVSLILGLGCLIHRNVLTWELLGFQKIGFVVLGLLPPPMFSMIFLIAMLILPGIVPDHTVWATISVVGVGSLLVGLMGASYDKLSSVVRRMPPWILMSIGIISIWTVTGLTSYFAFG